MTKWSSILLLLLFALAGNHFHLDIFYSLAFIFGSVAVLIALRLHGILISTVIALIAGLYTYYLWGHPYAAVIFTIEAIAVGLLLRTGIKSLIIADAIYWLILGVPMVWVFYSQVMGMANDVALLILLKQPINAIINAIIATFLLLMIPESWLSKIKAQKSTHIGITELVSSLLIATSFISAMTILLHEGGSGVTSLENHTAIELRTASTIIEPFIGNKNGSENANKSLEIINAGDINNETKYILLDKNNQLVSSNLERTKVDEFLQTGVKRNISSSLNQWLPSRGDLPVLRWWQQAYYFITTDVSAHGMGSLIVLKSSAQLISVIREQQLKSLSLLLLIVAIGIVFSYIISGWLNRTIIALSLQTRNLSARLRNNEKIIWPQSRIQELSDLSQHAEEMSDDMSLLIDKFVDEQEVLESKVKISNEILNENFARSSAIIETAVEGIVTMDEQGFIESFNPAAEALFAQKLDDVIGLNFVDLLKSNSHVDSDEMLRQILTLSNVASGKRLVELEALTKHGKQIPVEITVSEVGLKNKTLYTAFINDISERKQAERLKNEFISNVSHELRTPLTSIRGAIGLMASNRLGLIPEKARSMLTITLENTERLVRLINDILDIQKLEAGGLTFVLSPQKLQPIIEQCVEQNVPYAEQFGISLQLVNSSQDIVIRTEPDRLNQVLTNLISNAVKFSPEGETVVIMVSILGGNVQIGVKDKGPGIPKSFRDKIFNKFSQLDGSSTRRVGGTGLGLNIAKSYVKRMHGELDFDSEEGNGTTFYISIPLYQRESGIAIAT